MPRQTTLLTVDLRRPAEGRTTAQKLIDAGWEIVNDAASQRVEGVERDGVVMAPFEVLLTFERFGDPRMLRIDADKLGLMVDRLTATCSDGFVIDWDEQAEQCFCYAVTRHHPEPAAVLTRRQVARGVALVIKSDPMFFITLFRWRPSIYQRLVDPRLASC